MKIERTKEFDQSVLKLKDKIAKKRLDALIKKLENAASLKDISNVKPVVNNPNIYRIRTGDYRLFVLYRDFEVVILLIKYTKKDESTYNEFN